MSMCLADAADPFLFYSFLGFNTSVFFTSFPFSLFISGFIFRFLILTLLLERGRRKGRW